MIEIEQKWIERFYFDPVMAAHVIMGARLDTFQKARLRFFWFTPETIDSSGVGTGKTIVDFVYLNLRCILIPNHMEAIYFPNFQVGKDAFWNKYFPAFEEQSPIFRAQLAQANKREEEKANQRNPGAWISIVAGRWNMNRRHTKAVKHRISNLKRLDPPLPQPPAPSAPTSSKHTPAYLCLPAACRRRGG